MPQRPGLDRAPGRDLGGELGRAHTVIAASVFAAAAFTFWHYLRTYPPEWPELASTAPFGFDVSKGLGLASALLFVAALNLAAWQLGGWVRRALGDDRKDELTLLSQLALGLLLIPYLVLVLAAIHLLTPLALHAVLAVPCALALPRLIGLPARFGALVAGGSLLPGPGALRWLLIALAVFLTAGPLLAALGPFVVWDADVYHLAIPARYLSENGVYLTPFSMFTAFPAHMEMYYLLALGLSGELAAKLVHFEFGVLLLLLVHRVASAESARCGLLALLFLASEPLLYDVMSWAHNDLIAPFYALFAFISIREWLRTPDRALLLRAGLFAGACLATRYQGGAVVLGLLAALWFGPLRENVRARVRASLWLVGLASAALFPWLVRNWIFTGNPIAPVGQDFFHAPGNEYFSPIAIAQTYAFHDEIGMGRDLGALLRLPWNLTVGSTPHVYAESFGFQLSPLHAIGFGSAVAVALLRRRLDMARALAMLATLVLLWFPLSQLARFLMPTAGLLALVGAWAFDELLPRRAAAASALWIFPIVAFALAGSSQLDGLAGRYDLALGTASRAAAMRSRPTEAGVAALRRAVADDPDARIFVVGTSRSYVFRGLDIVPYQALEAPPTLAWLHESPTPRSLRCRLRELGATHLFINTRNVAEGARPRPVPGYGFDDYRRDMRRITGLMRRHTRVLYNEAGITFGRLEPAQDCAPPE